MANKKSKQKAAKPQVADRLRPEAIQDTANVVPGRSEAQLGKGISFSSKSFLWMARKAYERSNDQGLEAIVAVIMSVVAVEAFVNELGELAVSPPQMGEKKTETDREKVVALGSVLQDLEEQSVSTRTKLQVAHHLLTGKALDKGAMPYQDLDLLARIRNELVHKKAEVLVLHPSGKTLGDHHPLIIRLAQRGVIEAPSEKQAPQFQPFITRPEVALWAHNTALATIRFVMDLLPEGFVKQILNFGFEQAEPIPQP